MNNGMWFQLENLQNMFLQDIIIQHKKYNEIFEMNNVTSSEFLSEMKDLRLTPTFLRSEEQFRFWEKVLCSIKELRLKQKESENSRSREYLKLLLLGHDFYRYESQINFNKRRK